MRNQWWARGGLVAVTCAVVAAAGGSASANPAPEYPPVMIPTDFGPAQPDHYGASRYLLEHPDAAPAGTNDFSCVPSAEHPRPVVLAHGTDSTAYSDWSAIAPMLAQAGFCVFALDYGGLGQPDHFGVGDLWESTKQVGDFVDQVLAATGAQQADLVGFSQGASVTRYWIDKMGGAPKVGQWIGVASPSYGGIMYGLVPLARVVPGLTQVFQMATNLASVQQAEGAPYMVQLNEGGDTVPGVQYTTIGSRVDEMIQPFDNIALHGAGATNLVLQDLCPADMTGHFHMVYDPYVQQLVLNALDPEHAQTPACVPVALGTEIPGVILGAHS